MFRRLRLLSVALMIAAVLAFGAGCTEDAQCTEACEHTCDICDSGCSEGEIATCVQVCEDGLTAPERAQCILDTPVCEDLWKC